MFPRTKARVLLAEERASAVCRGPIQLTHFPSLRSRPRWRFYPWAVAALTVWTLALVFLSLTAGGPACDRWSALPWLECPHVP